MTIDQQFDKRFLVFVARDDAEYAKYQDPLFKPIRGCAIRGRTRMAEGMTRILVLSACVKCDTMVELCPRVSAAILATQNSPCDIEAFLKHLNSPGCVHLFIHFGGDGWMQRECDVREELAMLSAYCFWHVAALSSQRAELWDVSGKEIRVPTRMSEIERLQGLSAIGGVRGIMMKYVVWYELGRRAFPVDQTEAMLLGQYLTYMFETGIDGLFSREEAKWMLSFRECDALKPLWCVSKEMRHGRAGSMKQGKIVLDGRVAALFSKLVMGGGSRV